MPKTCQLSPPVMKHYLLSWYGVGLASADRVPVVVRTPAGPLGSLKCDPPKGNGRRPRKNTHGTSAGPWAPNYFCSCSKTVLNVQSCVCTARGLIEHIESRHRPATSTRPSGHGFRIQNRHPMSQYRPQTT